MNLYGYVGGDPVNAVDSSGLASKMEVPANIAYQHAFIYFPKKNCLGTDVIGFHLGIPKAWYAFQITRIGYPYAKGVVKAPDPSGRDKDSNKLRGRPIATNNDPAFEKALCECIKASKENPPLYGPNSVCGSWNDRMWECAKNKLGWP